MRDRETDSWWPIMVGKAIGGPMTGARLTELAVSEKTTWGAWRRRHPTSLVLTEDGRTHEPVNHYGEYFTSDRTFRNLQVGDSRLAAKTPIYAFRIGDRPYAVAHETIRGGALLHSKSILNHDVYVARRPEASIFESTTAYLVPAGLVTEGKEGLLVDGTALGTGDSKGLAALESTPGVQRLSGFDTYWYTWVAVNEATELLERSGP